MAATDDVDALVALKPDALVHYGPTAPYADDNIRRDDARSSVPASTYAPTARRRGVADRGPEPAELDRPDHRGVRAGDSSCFTTGIDPGFANDLFPMTLMGLCGEVRKVRASELLEYTNYEGDYDDEMGIGRAAGLQRRCSRSADILVLLGARRCR